MIIAVYEARPERVLAQQWEPGKWLAIDCEAEVVDGVLWVQRVIGRVPVKPGDWIVRDHDGTVNVLSDEEFQRRYRVRFELEPKEIK